VRNASGLAFFTSPDGGQGRWRNQDQDWLVAEADDSVVHLAFAVFSV
jgi:hypothetical protein